MEFFAEVTDTYGGEANYCWVRRYLITAASFRGAAIKLNKHEGFGRAFRMDWDSGDFRRYRVNNAAICAFISWADEETENQYMNIKRI